MKNNDQDKEIIITLKSGKEEKASVLFTFEVNGDDFILYELNHKAYAAKLNEDDSLTAVNEDEWNLVEKTYNQYIEAQDLKEKG